MITGCDGPRGRADGDFGGRPWITWWPRCRLAWRRRREGTAVPETDIEPEDPAATMATTAPRGSDARPAAHPPEQPPEPPAPWRRYRGWPVIAVPVATSALVGGYEIGGPSLWRDEAYAKDAIGRPVSQIFALLGHQDAVHGAYYLLMHVIAAAIGTSVTALRFPSLCAMIIATAFTAAIGRRAAALALAPGAGRAAAWMHPGADRAAVRPGVRDRAFYDLLRPDGQVVRDRDHVRHDRHLPADPGVSPRAGGGGGRPTRPPSR